MTGNEFRNIVRDSGIEIETISKQSKIPVSTIFYLYRKEVIEKHFIEKLKKTDLADLLGNSLPKGVSEYNKKYETLLEKYKLLEELNNALKDHVETLKLALKNKQP